MVLVPSMTLVVFVIDVVENTVETAVVFGVIYRDVESVGAWNLKLQHMSQF